MLSQRYSNAVVRLRSDYIAHMLSDENDYDSIHTVDCVNLEKRRVSTMKVWDVVKPVYRACVQLCGRRLGWKRAMGSIVVDLESSREYRLVDHEPFRVLDVVDTGKRVYYAGETEKNTVIYITFEPGVENYTS